DENDPACGRDELPSAPPVVSSATSTFMMATIQASSASATDFFNSLLGWHFLCPDTPSLAKLFNLLCADSNLPEYLFAVLPTGRRRHGRTRTIFGRTKWRIETPQGLVKSVRPFDPKDKLTMSNLWAFDHIGDRGDPGCRDP